jgi:bifunctional DNA-binding transcriptional regulator/antitoxin component of YhaV-PrlF toxin-antitoxin module
MVVREEKNLHPVKGSYYLVVPMPFVREHGLKEDPRVEVFYNGELLVRPLRTGLGHQKSGHEAGERGIRSGGAQKTGRARPCQEATEQE